MKIVMIYDQIQSGKGIKDDRMSAFRTSKRIMWTCYYDGTILKTGKWTYCMLFILWRWIL